MAQQTHRRPMRTWSLATFKSTFYILINWSHATIRFSAQNTIHCSEMQGKQRERERECFHLFLLRACMFVYEHVPLCKIHLCHRTLKPGSVIVDSKAEHIWLWVEVNAGAKLNKAVHLLLLQSKLATWSPLDSIKTRFVFSSSKLQCFLLAPCKDGIN